MPFVNVLLLNPKDSSHVQGTTTSHLGVFEIQDIKNGDYILTISFLGFKTQADRRSTTINGIFQKAVYYYDSQSFSFSISYKFGNKNIRAKRHNTGNQEERNRTGNLSYLIAIPYMKFFHEGIKFFQHRY